MHAPNFLPLLHFIITSLCFFIASAPSYCLEDKQHSTCNSSYKCGLPEFKLECEANHDPLIRIDGHDFRILGINGDEQTIRIARNDLEKDICPDRFGNTSLNSAHFRYGPDSVMALLFYAYESFVSFWGQRYRSCERNVTVPVSKSLICMACETSGGLCWSKTYFAEQTCLCRDRITSNFCGYVPDHVPVQGNKRDISVKVAIGISAAGIGTILTCYIVYWFVFKKSSGTCLLLSKKGREHQNIEAFLMQYGSLAPKAYRYSDIRKMTNSLQEKLGQGGHGGVYKGNLNGRPVAVKILNSTKGNGEEFINEVASISRTSHVNIVTLMGFCYNGRERALIYEFMPNGSLDQHIYAEDSKLGWETLYRIALGIGRGLEYLHRGCNARILHFDIKPHNILLDEDFCPKIADFGLAKLCLEKESMVSMLEARGTIGYIAPEVFSRNFGGVSHKSDVYSYGMMVLEMVGGRRNYSAERSHQSEIYFPRWAYQRLVTDEDLNIQGIEIKEEEEEIAEKMILVGLWCIQTDPSQRPPMSKAIEMLEGNLKAIQFPPKPFICSPSRSEGESMISLRKPTKPFRYSSSTSTLNSTASPSEE
ncbi:unnamed protein product [Withania somnifera]